MTEMRNPLGDKYSAYLQAGHKQRTFIAEWLTTRPDPEHCIGAIGNAALTGDEGAVIELQRIEGIQNPSIEIDSNGQNISLECPRRNCNGCLKLFIEADQASSQEVAALTVSDCQEQPQSKVNGSLKITS